jgi:hypothetical protein
LDRKKPSLGTTENNERNLHSSPPSTKEVEIVKNNNQMGYIIIKWDIQTVQ